MYEINLYPPVVTQIYMPAFAGTSCKVYFELSTLNSIDDLYHYDLNGTTVYKAAQVSVRRQYDNENALINDFRRGIMLKSILQDNEDEGSNRYYIQISESDIKNNFVKYQYYKVQIRLVESFSSSVIAQNFDKTDNFSTWLDSNLEHFSEWSSIILIKKINTPTFKVNINNNNDIGSINGQLELYSDFIQITGILLGSQEKLEIGKVEIYKDNKLIQDSGEIYAKNNTFSYTVKSLLMGQGQHLFKISYTTENLYSNNITKIVNVIASNGSSSNKIKLQENIRNDIGYIILKMTRNLTSSNSTDLNKRYYVYDAVQNALIVRTTIAEFKDDNGDKKGEVVFGKGTATYDSKRKTIICSSLFLDGIVTSNQRMIIRRASSKSDFFIWEKLDEINITAENVVEIDWYDYTAEPGVWYKYQVIIYDSNGNKVNELITDAASPVMLDTEDIFLNSEGEELIIRFNPNISNITTKIAESITDTLGSQYPFFRRNGNVKYRTFSLSGTITCFMNTDFNEFKGSPNDLYGSTPLSSLGKKEDSDSNRTIADLYGQYNKKNNINQYNDFIYEKYFRDKVQKFLQSSTVKLFRSLTEGNILVKLNDINFTPNQTLGRRIYDFSCTAYEVAECNEQNYSKYNILKNNVKLFKKGGVVV